jgi:hypothetical protein
MTSPALPLCVRISLVADISSESLNRVVINSKDGKIENCRAFLVYIVISSIINANERLMISKKSSIMDGSGIIMRKITKTTIIDTKLPLSLLSIFPPPFRQYIFRIEL